MLIRGLLYVLFIIGTVAYIVTRPVPESHAQVSLSAPITQQGIYTYMSGTVDWSDFTPGANAPVTGTDCSYRSEIHTVLMRCAVYAKGNGLGYMAVDLPPGFTPRGNQFMPVQVIIGDVGAAWPAYSVLQPTQILVELFSGTFTVGQAVVVNIEGFYQVK